MFGSGGDVVGAVKEVNESLVVLLAADLVPADDEAARVLVTAVETARCRVAALALRVLDAVEACGAHVADGHPSAVAMVRHVAKLSPAQSALRRRGLAMMADLPEIGAALRAGGLGIDQFDLLGRVHANRRVRWAMVDAQDWFLDVSARLSFKDFEQVVREWERLTDADGAAKANDGNHERRNATLIQNHFDLSWRLEGTFAALQGAEMAEIFGHYVDAERLADLEAARAEHGDAATLADAGRSEPQRRADALSRLFADAAAAPASAVPKEFVHNIVWDQATYTDALRRLAGHPSKLDIDSYRCETLDGVPLEPLEAAAHSLGVDAKLRRVVTDPSGVVIDLGRARTYTGGARFAAQVGATHCIWPGCGVVVTRCQIDHRHEHGQGGRTNQPNAAPLCGRHNRWKHRGYTVNRDPTGTWHTHRPDGTEIH